KQNSCFLPESGPISAMPNGVMRNGSSGGLVNGTSSGDHSIYGGKDIHGPHSSMDASTNVLPAQNASALLYGADNNGTTIKTESSYSSNADFAFCGNAFLESCQSIGDASGGSFSSSDLNGQPLNDALLDMESSSFGFLSQIPRNFSFSDLTEGFNQNTGTLIGESFPLLCFFSTFSPKVYWLYTLFVYHFVVCRSIRELWQVAISLI
uniref:Uncharacterized protein n=1 Tax=Aegilops tauschii subsp. strangulata TaxID=200361 RepID=A0A453SND6_AEGTS